MFNAGRGRIYASAKGVEDILNLKGLEVKTYGSVPNAGTSNLQQNQNANQGVPPTKVKNDSIANIKDADTSGASAHSGNADYVSNLTSMMIDS